MLKKISILSPGGYEKLQLISAPDLVPQPDQILIEVAYAGVNYADCLVRLGVYESAKRYVGFPITPGFEVSGVVKSIGSKVTRFKVGDSVIGFTLFNGYSSQVVVQESHAMPLPQKFTLAEGAAFPAVFMTAYYALKQIFYVYPGSKILVHSVAGGVGTALTQIAKSMNLQVVGVVGNSKKIEYAKSIGVDKIYDKSAADFSWDTIKSDYVDGFDAVYDANGYSTFLTSYEMLRPTGKLAVYGSHSLIPKQGGKINYVKAAWGLFKTPKFNPLQMITDNKSIICFNVSFLFKEHNLVTENIVGLQDLLSKNLLSAPKIKEFS
ncbi:MAG: zinc-binding dehydrogenase, partial [Bdellovibrionales bacterium]